MKQRFLIGVILAFAVSGVVLACEVRPSTAQTPVPTPDPAVEALSKQVTTLQQQFDLVKWVAGFLGMGTLVGLWAIYRGAKGQIDKGVARQVLGAKQDMQKRLQDAMLSVDGRHYPVFVSTAMAESQACQALLKDVGFTVVGPFEQDRMLSWPASKRLAGVFILKPATVADLDPFMKLMRDRNVPRCTVGLVIYADVGQLLRDEVNPALGDFFPWTFANSLATVPTAVFGMARLLDPKQLSPV